MDRAMYERMEREITNIVNSNLMRGNYRISGIDYSHNSNFIDAEKKAVVKSLWHSAADNAQERCSNAVVWNKIKDFSGSALEANYRLLLWTSIPLGPC